jgi:hypothetical protein
MMARMLDGGVDVRSQPLAVLKGTRSWVVGASSKVMVRPDAADIAFCLFLFAVLVARWTIVAPLPLPTGSDGGNWLALGRAMGQGTPMPGGVVYPPLVPALALLGEWVGRPVGALKYLAIVSSAAPALGCYLAARLCGLRWAGAIASAFLVAAGSVGEAAAWGGYPQLLGLGLMPVGLALLDRSLRSWRLGTALLAGVAISGTLAANELIGAAALLAAVVLAGIHLLYLGSRPPGVRRFLATVALVAAPSILLVPTYYPLVSAILATRGYAPADTGLSVQSVLPWVYRDDPAFWWPAQALAVAIPVVAVTHRRTRMWPIVFAILLSGTALLVGLRQVRFAYVMPVAGVLALAAWLDVVSSSRLRQLRVAALVLTVGLVPLVFYQAVTGIQLYRGQTVYYRVVPPDWVPVLQFLRDDTAPGSLVAVSPSVPAYPNGWWVQGMGERPALISANPAWLTFPGERTRAAEAGYIFDPSITVNESLRRARQLGVAYLVIDKRWDRAAEWSRAGQVAVDEYDVALVRV